MISQTICNLWPKLRDMLSRAECLVYLPQIVDLLKGRLTTYWIHFPVIRFSDYAASNKGCRFLDFCLQSEKFTHPNVRTYVEDFRVRRLCRGTRLFGYSDRSGCSLLGVVRRICLTLGTRSIMATTRFELGQALCNKY